MKSTTPFRLLVLLTLMSSALGGRAAGQSPEDEIPRWHANGFAGVDLTHTSQSVTTSDTQTDQFFPLGDLRLNSDGFLLDPRFLHISAAMEYQKGVNSADRGDFNMGGVNMAFGTVFLPKSHVPFRFNYTKTNHGLTGLGLDQNDDDQRIEAHWEMLFPKLPHVTVSFQDYGSTVHVPTSFADRTYSEKEFGLGVSDSWKQWQWSGNFSAGNGNSTGVSQLNLDNTFENTTRAAGFNLNRNFLDNRARLMFENRDIWRRDHLGGDGSSDTTEFDNTANFDMQVAERVTASAGYSFQKLDFTGGGFNQAIVPGGGGLQVIPLLSTTSNSVSGRVDYHPWNWLRLNQEVRNTQSSPVPGILESRTSFTDTTSTVTADRHWMGFDLMGSYSGQFQLAGTTLDHSPSSWSNSYSGRVGWGDVRYARITASGQNTRMNLVEQIGGFTHEKRVGAEIETHRFRLVRLRASGDYTNLELLNISGDTHTRMVNYTFQAEHRFVTASYTNSFMDGAGALFPLGLIDRQFLVVPLPISQLLATPLLDRTTHSQIVSLTGRPRRRLDVSFVWRVEDTQLPSSRENFNFLEADARYRLGKFSLEGGYSRNLTDVTLVTGLNGTRLALWYFRIGRDFKIF